MNGYIYANMMMYFMVGSLLSIFVASAYSMLALFSSIRKSNVKINENTNINLVFKNNLAAFNYACKNMNCTLKKGATLPAIVLDSKEEFGTEKSIKTQADGSQLAVVKIASNKGGFTALANTAGKKSIKLKPGDFVAWQAIQETHDIGIDSGNSTLGWIGLIIGTLKPELTSNGWVGDNQL